MVCDEDWNACILLDTDGDKQQQHARLQEINADQLLDHVRVRRHDKKTAQKKHDKGDQVGTLQCLFQCHLDLFTHAMPPGCSAGPG